MDSVLDTDARKPHWSSVISLGNVLMMVVMLATLVGLYATWGAQIAKVPGLEIAVTSNSVRVAKIEQHQSDTEIQTADRYREILDRLNYIQSALDRKADKRNGQ